MSRRVDRQERKIRRAIEHALLLALASSASCGAPESANLEGEPDVGEAESALTAEASCAPEPYTPSPPDACGKFIHLACGLPEGVKPASSCYLWLNDCKKICPGAYFNCHATERSCVDGKIVPDARGVVDIDCVTCAKGVGRIPQGFSLDRNSSPPRATGDWLAVAGAMESAAIHAFRRLARDLTRHGAPASLVTAARRAARDEVRHARAMGRAAERFGATVHAYRVAPWGERPLDEIALENAVEGCVRETYGALVAAFQATRAGDPRIAHLMTDIADDEARHAALSWAVAKWADARLDERARQRIAARCREAIEALHRESSAPVAPDLQGPLGTPTPEEQRLLIDVLQERLWRGLSAPSPSSRAA